MIVATLAQCFLVATGNHHDARQQRYRFLQKAQPCLTPAGRNPQKIIEKPGPDIHLETVERKSAIYPDITPVLWKTDRQTHTDKKSYHIFFWFLAFFHKNIHEPFTDYPNLI